MGYKKSVLVFVAVIAMLLAVSAHAGGRSGTEMSPTPLVLISGNVIDQNKAPVNVPLWLRLSIVEANGLVGEEVSSTFLSGGSFAFAFDPAIFRPGQYYIESYPFVPEPSSPSYLGSYVSFPVGYEGAYVVLVAELTLVRVTLDWNSVPKVIPAEGGLISWGFWVEGNHQNLDVYARIGDLSSTGYPASMQIGYPGSSEPMHLMSVCSWYVWQNIIVSGQLPNGKNQCIQIYVTEPGNYEKVLAWTGFCVPKLPVTETIEPKG